MSCHFLLLLPVVSIMNCFSFKVNLQEKSGLVHYDPKTATPQEICDYIDDMGFEASLPLLDRSDEASQCVLEIKGMTCNSCVQSIEGKGSAIRTL